MPPANCSAQVMQPTTRLVGEIVPAQQIRGIAGVFRALSWDFQDYDFPLFFLADPSGKLNLAKAAPGSEDNPITQAENRVRANLHLPGR
ncbi:hypothetical protein ACFLVD_00660 [Chloroflexota bacterium]